MYVIRAVSVVSSSCNDVNCYSYYDMLIEEDVALFDIRELVENYIEAAKLKITK